jgi:Lar family restriction alleviation protein
MAANELKPCPFCGGEAYYRKPIDEKGTAMVRVGVECKKCGAYPFSTMIYEGESEQRKKAVAAKFWNRRAEDGRK